MNSKFLMVGGISVVSIFFIYFIWVMCTATVTKDGCECNGSECLRSHSETNYEYDMMRENYHLVTKTVCDDRRYFTYVCDCYEYHWDLSGEF